VSFRLPLNLRRYPLRKHETLQAWDAADELLLQHLSENSPPRTAKLLTLNDSFGALTSALQGTDLTAYTDSFTSTRALELNVAATAASPAANAIHELRSLQGPYDLVLIRIPKNMSFFEDQLCHLTQHLHPSSQIVCGYMLKHQADASFKLLERYIGPATTSLARKKARLIFAAYQKSPAQSPYPIQVPIEGFDTPFTHHSNLFSREKLDIGTRFLLEHLPQGAFKSILDLGCANGIVGIAAQQLNPGAEITFCDESHMAIQSARTNYGSYFPTGNANFSWTDCCESVASGKLDLILCNPPFHQDHAIGDQTALRMLKDAHRALAPGGQLRVIGNSHLHYLGTLHRIFGNSEIVAKNSKFTIVDTIK
jgi:23S rRNA (guanine1835-N2)-methyltransferase